MSETRKTHTHRPRLVHRCDIAERLRSAQIEAGTYTAPADLTADNLDLYESIAEEAVANGRDTSGVQALRIQIIQALRSTIK